MKVVFQITKQIITAGIYILTKMRVNFSLNAQYHMVDCAKPNVKLGLFIQLMPLFNFSRLFFEYFPAIYDVFISLKSIRRTPSQSQKIVVITFFVDWRSINFRGCRGFTLTAPFIFLIEDYSKESCFIAGDNGF